MNVLIDKPWIIVPADLPRLEAALETAERRSLVAYDIMTERYEITSILARALAADAELFGAFEGAEASSVHYIMKMVAGAPNLRPAWFFDVKQQGEGLSDVGTHVVDLVQWTAFPDQAIDYRKDIRVLEGRRWPTEITREQFRRVTGEADFPAYLNAKDGRLDYYCNNSVSYTLRGKPVKLDILWGWEARPGTGDSYEATFRGTKGRIELRQGEEEKFRPEIYVAAPRAALQERLATLCNAYPGLELEEKGGRTRIVIPDRYRVGHEAHFAQVTNQFFRYLKDPQSIPAWERPNMAAKYFVTTKGVALAGR
jgi:predicted dehydrogenase